MYKIEGKHESFNDVVTRLQNEAEKKKADAINESRPTSGEKGKVAP